MTNFGSRFKEVNSLKEHNFVKNVTFYEKEQFSSAQLK